MGAGELWHHLLIRYECIMNKFGLSNFTRMLNQLIIMSDLSLKFPIRLVIQLINYTILTYISVNKYVLYLSYLKKNIMFKIKLIRN